MNYVQGYEKSEEKKNDRETSSPFSLKLQVHRPADLVNQDMGKNISNGENSGTAKRGQGRPKLKKQMII